MSETAGSYTRIDKGVRRGPKTRSGVVCKPSDPRDLGTWAIPADLNPDSVLERYMSEQTTGQIAAQYGISRKALTKWLRTVRPAEWKNAQIIRALCIKEDSEAGLAMAPDALSLARARELLKAAQFDLQALDKDYQPKQQVSVDVTVDLGDRLRDARDRIRTIQAEPAQIEEKP